MVERPFISSQFLFLRRKTFSKLSPLSLLPSFGSIGSRGGRGFGVLIFLQDGCITKIRDLDLPFYGLGIPIHRGIATLKCYIVNHVNNLILPSG